MAFRGTASVAMWANVNTQGTHSLRDSYNVSGIADVGGNTVRIEIDDNMLKHTKDFIRQYHKTIKELFDIP